MPEAHQPPGAFPPPDVLQFGCPACSRELSIPMTLAGVEGPCPFCAQLIAAPIPAAGQSARVLAPQVTPSAVPEPVVAATPEPGNILCGACGCELAIDASMAHLPGGPCPQCQTWIDLQGIQSPEIEEHSAEGAPPTTDPTGRRKSPSSEFNAEDPAMLIELNRSADVSGMDGKLNFPKINSEGQAESDAPTMERRTVKRRKKRRQLPPEFYVGQAAGELDAMGQETAGRMRREQFPGQEASDGGESREVERRRSRNEEKWEDSDESKVVRWLPVAFGILIAPIAGLFGALQFDVIDPADLRFWEPKSNYGSGSGYDPLAESIARTGQDLKGKAKGAYHVIETTVLDFLNAETWDDAKRMVTMENVLEDSAVSAFLKMFPREDYRGCEVKVIDYARISRTERFVFTLHLSNGINDGGEELLTFMIGEEMESGLAKIHGLQLYQSWKRTLTEFMETSGAADGRFYTEVRLVNEEASPNALILPDDESYVKLELRDLLVKEPWTKEVYVRKNGWAGGRALNTLTESWSKAILDLEWLQGPKGDAFIHVASIQSSNWGDFPAE